MKQKSILILASMITASLLYVSCTKNQHVLKMATTTSTDNTGLLDYLKPHINKDTGIDLQWVAVGTGKALELGKNCDVDILLVHAPQAEKKFIKKGFGINRRKIMYNDFVIIGPANDPAQIKGKKIVDLLKIINNKKYKFSSRGDNSGTHKKEISLWKSAGIAVPDKQKWYIQTGQGMLATINIAAEHKAYALTDRGTYIKYETNKKGKPPLVILAEGDSLLFNQYSIITINPGLCKNTRAVLCQKLTAWLTGKQAQKIIKEFKLNNKKLFIPNANR